MVVLFRTVKEKKGLILNDDVIVGNKTNGGFFLIIYFDNIFVWWLIIVANTRKMADKTGRVKRQNLNIFGVCMNELYTARLYTTQKESSKDPPPQRTPRKTIVSEHPL